MHVEKDGKFAVPQKSISLCRKESEAWELTGKAGRYDELCMSWPETLFTWWWQMGKNLNASKRAGGGVPISAAHNIGSVLLGQNTLNEDAAEQGTDTTDGNIVNETADIGTLADLKGDSIDSYRDHGKRGQGKNNEILFDLNQNAFTGHTRRSIGQMNWFYSEARVCQQCYNLYRDIDRRRDDIQRKQLKQLQKKDARGPAAQQEYDKEIEKKIFEQRRNVSRLARNVERAPGLLEGVDRNMPQGPTGYNYPNNNPRRGGAGAPKGALPPLPWQLRDEENAQMYQNPNKFESSIVRNIRGKAQGMARLVQQGKLMERVEMKKKMMVKGGMLDNDSQILDEGSMQEYNSEWQEFTGQSKADYEMKKPTKKVLGGLGETRRRGHSKNFNTDKLMHKWQRDADDLAKKVRGGGREQPTHSGYAQKENKANIRHQEQLLQQQQQQQYQDEYDNAYADVAEVNSRQDMGQYGNMDGVAEMNSLTQGSMVSALTMDPSMMNQDNYNSSMASNLNNNNNTSSKPSKHKSAALSKTEKMGELDDDEWIRAIMVKGKTDVSNMPGVMGGGGSVELDGGGSYASKSSVRSRNGARTPKGSLKVSFGPSNGVAKRSTTPIKRSSQYDDDGDSGDDDDDDDEGGIGWSPFVIPA